VTNAQTADRDPAVSADGRKIVFARGGSLYTIGIDGTGERQVTTGFLDQFPTWSPDGKRIAFTRKNTGSGDIYTIAAGGGDLKQLTSTPNIEDEAEWSPNGQRIAFSRNECDLNSNAGGPCVWTMNATGGGETLLTYEEKLGECDPNNTLDGYGHRRHSTQPTWSPDGSKIAYAGYFNVCSQTGGGGDIWVMNADGSGKVNIISDASKTERQPSWSPDGARIAFVRDGASSGPQLLTVGSAGGAITPLTSGEYDEDPSWGPLADLTAPLLTVVVAKTASLKKTVKSGLPAKGGCSEACKLSAVLVISRTAAKRLGLVKSANYTLGKGKATLTAPGSKKLTIKLTRKAKSKLRKARKVVATVQMTATDGSGNSRKAKKKVTLR
jgi:tricorn protease-like protein